MPAPGAVVASIVASDRFGFMTMDRDGGGWSMRAFDARGALIATCNCATAGARCMPDADSLTMA